MRYCPQKIVAFAAHLLSVGCLGPDCNDIREFSFKKMHMKMSFAKWPPFCYDPICWFNIICCRYVVLSLEVNSYTRDHSGYLLSHWEMILQCEVFSHWLSPYWKWSLYLQAKLSISIATLCNRWLSLYALIYLPIWKSGANVITGFNIILRSYVRCVRHPISHPYRCAMDCFV